MTTSLLPIGAEIERRVRGTPLLVLLDVDGTLAPIAARPEEAEVPVPTRRVVASLAVRPGVHVALVSGRAAADARRMVAVANVWVIGNHGCEVVSPDGESTVDERVAPYGPAMAQVANRLRNRTAQVDGVIVEDKGWTLSIHFRLANPSVVPGLRASIVDAIREPGLQLTEGKMVFEVRPPVTVHKGSAVLALADRLGALAEDASIVFAGDDRTDEDAFRVLGEHAPGAVTIRVSDAPVSTAAEFMVSGPEEFRSFLQWLAELRATSA